MNMPQKEIEQQLSELHEAAFGWAMVCCNRNLSEAEDALQSAYLKVIDQKAIFSGKSSVKTWFFGIVRNTAADLDRKKKRQQTMLGFLRLAGKRASDEKSNPEMLLEQDQDNVILIKALEKLSQRQKQVLHLVFYQDLTVNKAAQVMGVSAGSARKHFDRGKKAIKKHIQEAKRFSYEE